MDIFCIAVTIICAVVFWFDIRMKIDELQFDLDTYNKRMLFVSDSLYKIKLNSEKINMDIEGLMSAFKKEAEKKDNINLFKDIKKKMNKGLEIENQLKKSLYNKPESGWPTPKDIKKKRGRPLKNK